MSILLASGTDDGTDGVELVLELEPAEPVAPVALDGEAVEDDELALPGVPASALGGSGVVGAVVDGAGAGAVGADAGGAMVLVSSFLQAVRAIATKAANRSERFIVFLF